MVSQDDLYRFKPTRVLTDTPSIKGLESDENTSKEDLLDKGLLGLK